MREKGVALYFVENRPAEKSRLGIVVSRRVFKRARDRNRAKRIVREFFRLWKTRFQGNFDLVVRIIDHSNSCTHNSLREILIHLFRRAGILPF